MKAILRDIDCQGNIRLQCVPDSAIVRKAEPWFSPEGAQWRGQLYWGAVIERLGKGMGVKFARRYYAHLVAAVHPDSGSGRDYFRDGALMVLPMEFSAADTVMLDTPAGALAMPMAEEVDRAIAAAGAYATLKTGDLVLVRVDGADFPIAAPPQDFMFSAPGMQPYRFKVR